jgi:uncharacterized Zn-binding protein involved in type VI secretion
MPGYLYQVGATAMCPHGGQVTAIPSAPRVTLGGSPATVISDQFMIAGCAFTTPVPKPQPCVKVLWLMGALRVKINGQPAVLVDSKGVCQSVEQIPQGPPSVTLTQLRVKGM